MPELALFCGFGVLDLGWLGFRVHCLAVVGLRDLGLVMFRM